MALAAAGGFDMVSMVIRQPWCRFTTPDLLRGRVSAVNCVLIGASNELGEFDRASPRRFWHRARGPVGRPGNPGGRRYGPGFFPSYVTPIDWRGPTQSTPPRDSDHHGFKDMHSEESLVLSPWS